MSCRQLVDGIEILDGSDICVTAVDECPITSFSFEYLDNYMAAQHTGKNNLDQFWLSTEDKEIAKKENIQKLIDQNLWP